MATSLTLLSGCLKINRHYDIITQNIAFILPKKQDPLSSVVQFYNNEGKIMETRKYLLTQK